MFKEKPGKVWCLTARNRSPEPGKSLRLSSEAREQLGDSCALKVPVTATRPVLLVNQVIVTHTRLISKQESSIEEILPSNQPIGK